MRVKTATIKEIARHIEAGKICFIHRKKGSVKAIEVLTEGDAATEESQKELTALEENTKQYMKIPRLSDLDEINAMKDFLEEEDISISKAIKKELTNALKRKQPMRNFLQVVNSGEELQQYWLNFKSKWTRVWVADYFIAAYNY